MGFVFSGAPPAMLKGGDQSTSQDSTTSSFASFAAAEQTAPPSRNSSSLGSSITTPSFSNPTHPNFSFGSTSTPAFGAANPFARTSGSQSGAQASSTTPRLAFNFGSSTSSSTSSTPLCATQASVTPPPVEIDETVATDPISKALLRAVQGKRALFNKDEIAADRVIKDMIDSVKGQRSDVLALLPELRKVQSESPAVTKFMHLMFGKLASLEKSKPPAFATFAAKQERQENEEETAIEMFALRDDEQEEVKCVAQQCRREYFENIEAWREHFWADHRTFWTEFKATKKPAKPSAIMRSASDQTDHTTRPDNTVPKIGRKHWRTKEVAERLARGLRAGGHIHYPEGAKVLADIIIDMFYDNFKSEDAADSATAILGKDHNEQDYNQMFDLINDASEDLNDAEKAYLDYLPKIRQTSAAPPKGPQADDRKVYKLREPITSRATNPKATEVAPKKDVFRFLDLPPEMRNLVYRELLAPAPGYIGLSNPQYIKRKGYFRDSKCKPRILEACKQIYKEAKDIMYEENFICVATSNLWEVNMPIIHKLLLPDHALPRITSLVLVCQAQMMQQDTPMEYIKGLHWKQFQDMTKLKHLRICMVEREANVGQEHQKKWILEQIIERVPAKCELTFEARSGFEDEYVQGLIDDVDEQKKMRVERQYTDAREVDGEVMAALVKSSKAKQGCKSGDARDYRFPERAIKLTPLVAADAIDPSIVLGGGK